MDELAAKQVEPLKKKIKLLEQQLHDKASRWNGDGLLLVIFPPRFMYCIPKFSNKCITLAPFRVCVFMRIAFEMSLVV
jgi:hypothetical protein